MKFGSGIFRHAFPAMTAALWLAAAAGGDPADWTYYRAFGGRAAAGEVKSLVADARYLYAFSTAGGIRYDRLLDKWDFSFQVKPPDFAYEFTAFDPVLGDIYFVSGGRATPYRQAADIYYSALQFPGRIQEIAFDAGRVWARTNTGLYSCDRFTKAVRAEKEPGPGLEWSGQLNVRNLRADTRLAFLSPYFQMDRWAELHPVTAVALEPASFGLWVAYAGMGLWRFDRATQLGQQVTQGFLASSDVRAMAASGGRIAMAGQGGATVVDADAGPAPAEELRPAGGRWQQLGRLFNLDLDNYQLRCLATDDRHLFIGTDRGIVRLADGDDFAAVITSADGLPLDKVNCLQLSGDSLWAGTDWGAALYIISLRAVTAVPSQLSELIVNGMAEDGRYLYLATNRGGIRLDKADSLRPGRFDEASPPEMSRELRAVAADGGDIWWLAPDALVRHQPEPGRWTKHLAAGNYIAGLAQALAVDSLNVWIGTDAGLVRYFREFDRWYVYHREDGLMDESVLAACAAAGALWTGHPTGAGRFDWAKQYHLLKGER